MAANQTERSKSKQRSTIKFWMAANHTKFTEECVMFPKQHIFVKINHG